MPSSAKYSLQTLTRLGVLLAGAIALRLIESGAVLSFICMAFAIKHNWFSAWGIGLLGAFCHNCGQIMVASYLMSTAAIFSYLPFLLLLGIPTGLFTGFLAKIFLDRFAQIQ